MQCERRDKILSVLLYIVCHHVTFCCLTNKAPNTLYCFI